LLKAASASLDINRLLRLAIYYERAGIRPHRIAARRRA